MTAPADAETISTPRKLPDALLALGHHVGERVEAAWHAHQAGTVAAAEFRSVATALMVGGIRRAESLALTAFTLSHLAATADVPVIRGGAASHTAPRLSLDRAMDTVLGGDLDDVGTRLHRLGRAEVGRAGQDQYQRAMQATDTVEGWVRDLETGACQLCRWWWRNGRVWPKTHTMPTHVGCCCTPRAVFVASHQVRRVSRRAQQASAERAAKNREAQRAATVARER